MRIILPFRAFSVNEQFCKDRKYGMRQAAKDFCYQVNFQLDKYKEDFASIRDTFDSKNHGLSIEITHYYKDFYNSKGEIRPTVLDLTNTEKLLMDLVVDREHHGPSPYKSPNLNLSDRNVVEVISRKLPSKSDHITIDISIVALPRQLF